MSVRLASNPIICHRALAGHAHWQNIAKDKQESERKRSVINTKWLPRIRREARNGSDIEKNVNLKKLIEQAINGGAVMSAIKKQLNVWDNVNFKEFQFGVQGRSGFAALIDCASDSPNKTENEIQTFLRRHNFKYSPVRFMFDKTKKIMCQLPEGISDDEIEELALLCGTEQYEIDTLDKTIIFSIDDTEEKSAIKELNDQKLAILSNSIHYRPKESVVVSDDEGKRRIGLFLENLSTLPEVDNIYHNIMNINEIESK